MRIFGFSNMPCESVKASCTNDYCHNNGICVKLPYSFDNWCQCNPGFTGQRCQEKDQIAKIGSVMSMIVPVPTITDFSFKVKDFQNLTSTEFMKTQSLIQDLEKKLKDSY